MTEKTQKMNINDVIKTLSQKTLESIEVIKKAQAEITVTLENMRKKESQLIKEARQKAEEEMLLMQKKAEEEAIKAREEKLKAEQEEAKQEAEPKKAEEKVEEKASVKIEEKKDAFEVEKKEEEKPEIKQVEIKQAPSEQVVQIPQTRQEKQTRPLRDDAAVRNAQMQAARTQKQPKQYERPPRPQKPAADFVSKEKDADAKTQFTKKRTVSIAAPTVTAEKGKVSNYDPNRSNYIRVFDGEKKGKSKKALEKERRALLLDEEIERARKPKKRQQPQQKPEAIVIEKAVITGNTVTIKTLAEKIGKPASEIIKKLFMLGIIATINNEIDYDTAALIASEFGVELEQKLEQTAESVLAAMDTEDDPEKLVKRPPVITIMGHVDHGKTSLLDSIRSSRVAEREAGGITQHIGAYTVEVNGQSITFLDTPGHEAFTSMRARGAQVTDIVILVVAADDGIMPQTVEAINHAKAANVPIIVAVNKIDKPTANVERVKQELTEYGLVWEDWGGDTIIVPVSAHTREGLDTLLEMVLLMADMLDLKANPDGMAKGVIVEAKLDKTKGPLATVLVQNGTLRIGNTVIAGTSSGRIRAMTDDKGEKVNFALPSQPVEVLGFDFVPNAGDIMHAVEADKLTKQLVEERKNRIKTEQLKKAAAKVSLDELFKQISEGQIKELNIIVKADVQGSVEAIKQSLEKLSNDEVRVKCIHGGVGGITESDVMLASASNAIIIGFNIRPDTAARASAERESVDIRLYNVIYNAIEDIEKAMKGLLEPVFREVILGKAEVRETFKASSIGTIAGCYVTEGKVVRNASIRLIRNDIVIHEGKIESLKRFKDDVREVLAGYECGITLNNYNDIKVGDIFEAYTEEEVKE